MMIFFDIDDTLVDSEAAHKIAVKKILEDYSLKVNPDDIFSEWIDITNRYLKLYFEKKMTLTEQRTSRIKELCKISGREIHDEEALLIYFDYHRHFLQSCVAFPETIPVLEKLKDFKLGIITNGPVSDQINKLKDNHLIRFFDPIIISEEVGFSKPQKEIFDIAAERSNRLLSECIFIGDSYELDYLGGTNAGMKTIWLDRKKSQPKPYCESIQSLHELIGYLQLK
ncbi:MAG TPA: hypothetical protein DD458_24340 [Prolixibacteraceae bacterium]|nr:hypothetical protein [Prolixibacteraceae bacterium]HCR90767.1 hypothetical protein [Prolixibacteraceae bacterium]HCU60028.1 hypothetical protein [Prolixibacteraceae bacterium]